MKSFHVFALLLAALLLSPALAFQTKDTKDTAKDKAGKDDPKPPKKLKGTLPTGYRKLGLTDEQSSAYTRFRPITATRSRTFRRCS
jgi:hypothetical protein